MPRLTRRALPTPTVALARYLIGKTLVRATPRGRMAGRIVETEAYPPGDPTAYHRPGLTTSNAPLFAARGHAYVRMVYGACFNLNLAAEAAGIGGGGADTRARAARRPASSCNATIRPSRSPR